MHTVYVGVVVALAVSLGDAALVRLCVPEGVMESCAEMTRESSLADLTLQCVSGPDRYGCLEKLGANEVDLTMAGGEDVFLARELLNLQLQVVAETRDRDMQNEPSRYDGVALVRRSQISSLESLRNGQAKSCHTGYGRNAGWNIPFSHLLEKGLVEMQCNIDATVVEHDVRALSAFVSAACLPGSWAPDNETDFRLKQRYSNLCSLCDVPGKCLREDSYSGYEGAIDCVVRGSGNVAWTKMSAVRKYFEERQQRVSTADYGLLCSDGRVLDLNEYTRGCAWASRPWNAWLVLSANRNKRGILSALERIMTTASPGTGGEGATIRPWAKPVLGIKKSSVLHTRSPPVSTRDYLKEHKYDTTIERLGCPEEPVKLCVESQPTLQKCEALKHVLKSRRVRPALECVTPSPSQDCLAMVENGGAHITTADGGDVYRGHVQHSLVPVVSERHGLQDASYFAVAVTRANSGITSLSQLRGKKSCHTGIGRTAGWKIPVVTLLEAGLLEEGNCDFPGQMGNFFSSSCVPGAKSPQYDPQGTNPSSLCSLCVGNNGEGVCDRGPTEAYSGYTGAFRCLVEGGGDVAFIKHITVRDNTNGNNNASWAANLRAVDFKLLCRNTGTADVVDYNTCHLARVPAHKVLMSSNLNPVMQEEVRILLLRASDKFPKGQDVFRMFGTFKGKQDLIFKDSATELVNVRNDTFHNSLEDAYYRTLSRMDACQGTTMSLTGVCGRTIALKLHNTKSLPLAEMDSTCSNSLLPSMAEQEMHARFALQNEKLENIIKYLQTGSFAVGLTKNQRRVIRRQASSYSWDSMKQVLYVCSQDGRKREIIRSPEELTRILRLYHGSGIGGHSGWQGTYGKIVEHYFWHGVKEDVKHYVAACDKCQRFAPLKTMAPEMKPIKVKAPLELVGMDLIDGVPL